MSPDDSRANAGRNGRLAAAATKRPSIVGIREWDAACQPDHDQRRSDRIGAHLGKIALVTGASRGIGRRLRSSWRAMGPT